MQKLIYGIKTKYFLIPFLIATLLEIGTFTGTVGSSTSLILFVTLLLFTYSLWQNHEKRYLIKFVLAVVLINSFALHISSVLQNFQTYLCAVILTAFLFFLLLTKPVNIYTKREFGYLAFAVVSQILLAALALIFLLY